MSSDLPTANSSTTTTTTKIKNEDDSIIVDAIYQHILDQVCRRVASNYHCLLKTTTNLTLLGEEPPSRLQLFPELYGDKDDHNNTNTSTERMEDELQEYATEVAPGTIMLTTTTPTKKRMRAADETNEFQQREGTKNKQNDDDDEDNNDDDDDDDDDDKDEDFKVDENDDGDDDDDDFDDDDDEKGPDASLKDGSDTKDKAEEASAIDAVPTTATTTDAASASSVPSSDQHRQQPPFNQEDKDDPKFTRGLDIYGRLPPKEPKQTCQCRLCDRHVSTMRFASHLDKCMGLSTARTAGGAGGGGGMQSQRARTNSMG